MAKDDIVLPNFEDEEVPSLYSIYETDRSLEEDGKWFDITAGVRFKVRRFSSKESQRIRNKLEEPYVKNHRGKIPESHQERLAVLQVANALVVDWEGVKDRKGKMIEFSRANVLKLIEDLPNLRDQIITLSLDLENFKNENEEETVGN